MAFSCRILPRVSSLPCVSIYYRHIRAKRCLMRHAVADDIGARLHFVALKPISCRRKACATIGDDNMAHIHILLALIRLQKMPSPENIRCKCFIVGLLAPRRNISLRINIGSAIFAKTINGAMVVTARKLLSEKRSSSATSAFGPP